MFLCTIVPLPPKGGARSLRGWFVIVGVGERESGKACFWVKTGVIFSRWREIIVDS